MRYGGASGFPRGGSPGAGSAVWGEVGVRLSAPGGA
jgi:hypothetical protein